MSDETKKNETFETLKIGVEAFRPIIEERYMRSVRGLFWKMVEDHGARLGGIYNSWEYARSFSGLVSMNIESATPESEEEAAALRACRIIAKKKISETKLAKNAAEYSRAVVESWLTKITKKLGNVTEVVVHNFTANGFSISCKRDDASVYIVQNTVYKVSTKGTPFFQWPALIYVNGKRVAEKDFNRQ